MKKIGSVILAAGEGSRLKWNTPKPLLSLLGKRLIEFPMLALKDFLGNDLSNSAISLVVGHKKEEVTDYIKNCSTSQGLTLHFPVQERQLGTADALKSYFANVEDAKDFPYTLVMCADVPLIEGEDLERLYSFLLENNLDGAVASFQAKVPKGYGRIVREGGGVRIVEEKDANPSQKKITEVNSGLYLFKTDFVLSYLEKIDNNNNSGEFYLPDLIQKDRNCDAFCFEEELPFMGVNDLSQLAEAEKHLYARKNKELMLSGVRIIQPDTVFLDWDVEVFQGVTISPFVTIKGKSQVGSGALIEQNVYIENSIIHEGAEIKAYSHLENSTVYQEASIGPYGRLRPGSHIGKKAKIGNFVEVKKSVLHDGVKVSHLSYVGDAEVGEETNIGCGFITCNYDGKNKHKTTIGKGSFIGSDSQTIAPVEIGDNCFVASGSTIGSSMPSGSFAISRSRQVTKEGMAKKFLNSKEQ